MDGWTGDGITSFAATRPPSWGLWQDDSVVEIHLFLICDRTLQNYFCLSLYLFFFYNLAFIDCFLLLFETTSNAKEYMNITQVSIFSSFSHHHHHRHHQEMPTIEPSSVFSDGLIIDPPLSSESISTNYPTSLLQMNNSQFQAFNSRTPTSSSSASSL